VVLRRGLDEQAGVARVAQQVLERGDWATALEALKEARQAHASNTLISDLMERAAAMVVDCIILLLITWGSTIASSQSYHPDSAYNKFVALGMLSFFIMQMIFLAVGIFLGCAMKKHKQASAVGIWLLLGTYFLSVMISMNSDLDKIKFLSPFKYFDAGQLLRDSKLEMPYVILSAGVIIVLIAAAYFTYSKRDLYI
jgi:ABC-2 type transport system permease protein